MQHRMTRWPLLAGVPLGAAVALSVLACGPAAAQKNSGPLLPVGPPPMVTPTRPNIPPPTYAPAVRPPMGQAPGGPMAGAAGGNPDVERQAQALPIDPATRDMQDQVPADPRRVERALGLRPARGPVTDLRGHTATAREIVDALAPR